MYSLTRGVIQLIFKYKAILSGLPWCIVKSPLANAVDMGLIPGSRRFPGEGNGNPPQYACLENYMHRGAWHAVVPGASKSQTWLSMHSVSVPCHWDLAAIFKIGI